MSATDILIAEATALAAPRFFGLLAPRRDNLILAATKYHAAGLTLKAERRWLEAANCFRQAATYSRMCGDSNRLFHATEQLIRMLIANGQYDDAHVMIMDGFLSVGATGGFVERMDVRLCAALELAPLFEATHPALALSLWERCTEMCALRNLTVRKCMCLNARAILKARQGSYGEAAALHEQCFREGRGTPSASGPSLTFHLRQHAGTAVLLHLLHSGNVVLAQAKAAEFLALDYSLVDDRCWILATRVLAAVETMDARAFTDAARRYAVIALEPWFKAVLLRIKALITGIGEAGEL
jgi:hypothetical protein